MEKNMRDPITGEWDDPLGDWANEAPADAPVDRSDIGAGGGDASSDNVRGDRTHNHGGDSEDERIGYGRPPRKFQYKKGQSSPNPSGRPKGVKNEATIIKEILEEKVRIRVDGRVRTVTMRAAILMRFRDAALKGDVKSATFILNRQNQQSSNEPARDELDQDDRAIIEAFKQDLQDAGKGTKS